MLYRFQQGNCNDLSALLYGQPTEQKWGTLILLRIIRNCWMNMTEMTEFVSLETVMALQQKMSVKASNLSIFVLEMLF